MIDPALRDRAYRHGLRQLRRLTLFLTLLPAGLVLAIGAAFHGDQPWRDLFAVVAVFAVAGFGGSALIVALFRLGHRGVPGLSPGPPLAVLDRERRQRIEAAVDEGRHLDGEDEAMARELAAARVSTRWVALLPFPVAPTCYVALHQHLGDLSRPHAAFWTAVGLVGTLALRREVRQGRRYLGSSPTAE